jgi:hypothetical protein
MQILHELANQTSNSTWPSRTVHDAQLSKAPITFTPETVKYVSLVLRKS